VSDLRVLDREREEREGGWEDRTIPILRTRIGLEIDDEIESGWTKRWRWNDEESRRVGGS